MTRAPFSLVLTTLALGCLMPARADDWPQFRHDATRTAASKDRLQFPLKSLWEWKTRGPRGHTPLYYAAVWQDKVFFTASEGATRSLICADARTGAVKWRQKLETEQLEFVVSDTVGPAVTAGGQVFVYDWMTAENVGHKGQRYSSSGAVEGVNSFTVRTFDAQTAREGALFPLAAMGANGILPRLSLTETAAGQEVRSVPPTFIGCPP